MTSWLFSIPALADLALLILRLVVGLMFAMSGFFKLTDPERKQKMQESLGKAGVPVTLAPLLSALELLGGLSLVFGLLTVPGALVLLVITLGALVTTSLPEAEGQGIHKLENVLYTPEAILGSGLLVLVATGAGAWSLDHLLH